MSTETNNMALVQNYIEDFWSDGHLDNPGENFFADNFVAHDPAQPEPVRGYEKFVRGGEMALQGLTILEHRIENLIASGDKVAVHYIIRGKHTGFLFGLPPTNREATLEGMSIFRLVNGKIAETWGVADSLKVLQELEILPQIGIRSSTTAS